VTKMWFDVDWQFGFLWRLREMCDVVTKIQVCAYSKNRTHVLEPSAVWMGIIHFTKVQIKNIDKFIIICSETACRTNTKPNFFFLCFADRDSQNTLSN